MGSGEEKRNFQLERHPSTEVQRQIDDWDIFRVPSRDQAEKICGQVVEAGVEQVNGEDYERF